MKLWKRVICCLPLLVLIVYIVINSLPATLVVEQKGNEVHIYYTNFIYENSIDKYVLDFFLVSLIWVFVLGLTSKERSAWHEAKKKKAWWKRNEAS